MTLEIPLPARAELAGIFERLAIPEPDRAEILAGWPSASDRATADVLASAYGALAGDMGGYAQLTLPSAPAGSGPTSRYLYVYVFLALVPLVRRYHAARGVPDDVAWATLADLGRNLARDRLLFGEGGLRTISWLTLHFRGVIYELGRLQFNRRDPSRARVGATDEPEPVLGVHIPESGPLTPELTEESFGRARPFFERHFPETSVRLGVCNSWLLDPQLADYLSAESNIIRFQRRFTLFGEGSEGSADVLRFVFHRIDPDLDALPQRTTLERAIVTHLRAGGHWRNRTGWLPL